MKYIILFFLSFPCFAITCTYSNDDVVIQAAINALPSQGGSIDIDRGNCDIRNTLVINGKYGVKVSGAGATGALGATNLIWNGPAGGIVFQFNQARDSSLENVSIFTWGSIGTGVDIDDLTGVGQISTHITLRRVRIGAADYGVYVARTSTRNNDLHIFEDVINDGAGIAGYTFNSRQSKWHHIIRGSIASKQIGINDIYGSFHSDGTNFSWNVIDVQLTNPTDVINLTDSQSEGANRFLNDASSSGNAWNVNIKGGRLSASNMASDGNFITYHRRGALNITGVDFAQGSNRPNFKIQADNDPGAMLNSIGNIFPNNTPYGASRTLLNSIGNLYIDSNGAGQPMANSIR